MTSLQLAARLGSRTPRVCSFPPAPTSAGQDAIDLAASAGLYLDEWQQDVLRASLGEGVGGRWAAGEVGLVVPRQNGKGSVLEARELAGLFLFGESILHTSHEFKTSMDHYRRIERLIRNTPDLHRKVHSYPKAPGTEGIVMRDGRALRFMARTKGAGRGFSPDVVMLDEAFALTHEQMAALMPAMSARPNLQLWYTSSPPLDGISGEPLFALRARGEAPGGADGLCWFDWGAQLGVNADDIDAWYASNPALGIRILEQTVARERAAMNAEGFARERLGVWPRTMAERWAVITEGEWEDALDDSSSPDDPVVFALWTSLDRANSAISVVGARSDGDLHGEVVDHRPNVMWMLERAVDLVKKWKPARLVVDAGGAAGSLVADLQAALVPDHLEEITLLTSRDVAKGYGSLHDAVKAKGAAEDLKRLRIRPHDALTTAVAGATTRRIGDGTTWDSRDGTVDISPLRSMTDALQGFLTLPKPEPVYQAASANVTQAPTDNFWRSTQRLNL